MTTLAGAITTLRTMHVRVATTSCTCGRLRCPELAVLESVPRDDSPPFVNVEPVTFDSMGSPTYAWQTAEDG